MDVLTAAHSKLTRQESRDHWPEDYAKPDATTLWRWLSRGVAQGIVRQQGTGRLNDPFRYWLPAREAEWMEDSLYRLRCRDEAARAEVERLRLSPPEAG